MRNKRIIKPLYTESIDDLITQIHYDISENNQESLKKLIESLHYADLASVLDSSTYKLQKSLISLIQDSINPETLVWMCSVAKTTLLEVIVYEKVSHLIEELDLEDAIEVLDSYDEEEKNSLISYLSISNHVFL